ncbi:MAG: prepilin peptidase [Erysipelotrichaceae bacterium]|nr:prepilin peptidase [Erysipelotrichaceae bacterium]
MKDIPMIMMMFLCGSIAGSFLNCICDRTICNKSLLTRSRCPDCGHVLGFFDLIPVFSYLFLKGRCRYCKKTIDPFCFCSEVIAGTLYVLVYFRFGICTELIGNLTLISVLLTISLSDAKSMLIPDPVLFLLFLIRIVFFFLMKEEAETFMIRLLGSSLLSVFLYAYVHLSERLAGKEMMGNGDVILILMLGSFMNVKEDLLALFLSCLIALVYGIPFIKKKQGRCFPFAPAICLAYLIMLLYREPIMRFYSSLFQK